jgi:hypothetical protein
MNRGIQKHWPEKNIEVGLNISPHLYYLQFDTMPTSSRFFI